MSHSSISMANDEAPIRAGKGMEAASRSPTTGSISAQNAAPCGRDAARNGDVANSVLELSDSVASQPEGRILSGGTSEGRGKAIWASQNENVRIPDTMVNMVRFFCKH